MSSPPGNPKKLWLSALLFALAYLACAEIGALLSVRNSPYVSFWLPAGLYLGVLLLNETRSWPWLLLAAAVGNFVFNAFSQTPVLTSLGFFGASTLEAVMGAMLMRRFVAKKPELATLDEFLGLVAYAVLCSTTLAATVGAWTLTASGMSQSYWGTWLIWWCNHAMANLLVAPFLLVWFSKPHFTNQYLRRRGKALEAAILTALMVTVVWMIMVEGKGINSTYKSRLLPLLFWSGLRFGMRGATSANLLLALLMGYFTAHFKIGLSPADLATGDYIFTLTTGLMIAVFVSVIPTLIILDRDQKVEELQESEERFRQLTQAAFEGICISENGIICDINEQGLKMFGYERQEMIGKPIVEMVAPESRAKVAEAIRAGTELMYGHKLLRKDGTIFLAEAQAKRAKVGNRTLRMTALRDITDRKAVEGALLEAGQLNREIINSAQEGILVLGRDLRYQIWNPFMEKLTGFKAERVVGRTPLEVFPFLKETGVMEMVEKALAGEVVGPLDFPFRLEETGREGWSSEMLAPLRNTKGEIIGVIASVRDTTESKKIEEALRLSEERLRSIFNNAPVGIFQSTMNRLLFVNPAMATMFGYESPAAMIARPDHPEAFYADPEQRRKMISDVAASGTYSAHEIKERRRDGSIFITTTQMRAIRDEAGQIKFLEGFVEDISERKQAEAALKLSDFSVNQCSLPTFWVARDAKIMRTNQAACALLGYTPSELLKLSVLDINARQTQEGWPSHWGELKDRKHLRFETRLRRQDGHLVPVEVDLDWFEFGGQEYDFAFVRDITERKRLEAVAGEQRRILEMIASDAPLKTSLNALLHMIETQAEEVLSSIQLMEPDGKHLRHFTALRLPETFIQVIAKPPVGPCVGSCGTAAFRRQPVYVADICTDPLWEDYKEFALAHGLRACWSAPIFDSQQRVLGTVAVYHRQPGLPNEEQKALLDLAAHTAAIAVGRQQAQAALQETESQMRQMQKMEGIGQLAGGVAHDFNNILAALMMQTELVRTVPALPDEAQEGLTNVQSYVQRAADLTRQLLLFSRRQVMRTRLLEMNELVTNLSKMLQRVIGEDVTLELCAHPDPLMVRADAGMMDQVLVNLAVNARDAMPGGGRLIITTGEAIVDEAVRRLHPDAEPGRYVWFSVSDTGHGIAPDILPRIFEPFFTTKDVGKGTGLGLATVFGIVKQHRGWLKVENRPGEGVTFQVFLPVNIAPTSDPAQPGAAHQPAAGKTTILLVDDELGVLKPTRKFLERYGFQVLEAASGAEALKHWEQNRGKVSLLLTDLVMPGGMNGHELARRLQKEQPDLKIIFASGYSAEIAGQEISLRPGEAFIQKPFAIEDLIKIIREKLDA